VREEHTSIHNERGFEVSPLEKIYFDYKLGYSPQQEKSPELSLAAGAKACLARKFGSLL
jgi:hypothetical protein